MRYLTIILATLGCCVVAAPGAATAAPPAVGSAAPAPQEGAPIAADYAGAVVIGPRSYCTSSSGADGAGAGLCVDVRGNVYSRTWIRTGARGWKRGKLISSSYAGAAIAFPYAAGWHWLYTPTTGLVVIATRSLGAPQYGK
ncbi:MAG: hypothetical protein JWN72_1178 [Thermoleophilia bacterium]|nr:hypothetical protein [Thermoleophilia bacterium]